MSNTDGTPNPPPTSPAPAAACSPHTPTEPELVRLTRLARLEREHGADTDDVRPNQDGDQDRPDVRRVLFEPGADAEEEPNVGGQPPLAPRRLAFPPEPSRERPRTPGPPERQPKKRRPNGRAHGKTGTKPQAPREEEPPRPEQARSGTSSPPSSTIPWQAPVDESGAATSSPQPMSLAQSNDGYVHIGSTSSSSPVASQH
eukprot:SAG22_NODE_1073_length_5696_cov_4.682687_4_plen_201_part_00